MHAIRRTICRIGQVCGRKKGLRMLVLVIYAIFASRFYYSVQDTSIFMGMFRIAPAMSHPDLALNMYPLLFMVGGIALALEQCSEYLMIPDYLVYVRSRRGWSHFCRYCALLLFYCVLFAGVQLIIAVMIVPGGQREYLLMTAICAALTLAVLMLIANVGYLLDCRVLGYVAAAALYIALLSLDGVRPMVNILVDWRHPMLGTCFDSSFSSARYGESHCFRACGNVLNFSKTKCWLQYGAMQRRNDKMYVEVHHLTKTIKRKTVLRDVNAEFERGNIYGIVGPNGSGKTMLLRAICGFIRPDTGTVSIDGKPVEFNKKLPESVGVIIENPGFIPSQSAMENLRYLADINHAFDQHEIMRLLDLFGLRNHAQEKVRSYSLGMRQKLAIVQALMEHQPLILLDEPTNGLDERSVTVFLEEMKRQRDAGRTILIASHHSDELSQIANHLYFMSDGVLSSSDTDCC